MQIKLIYRFISSKIAMMCATAFLITSCNKDLPEATPIVYPDANPVAKTLGEEISSNPDYSFFKAALTKVGAMSMLNDNSRQFTVFLPNNNGFRAAGITSEEALNAMPVQTLGAIVQYHLIPGQQFIKDSISTAFPNVQLPSFLTIGTLPGTTVPIKMSIFPSRRGATLWANTMPVTTADLKFKNGIIHLVASVVAPPSALLKQMMYSEPELSFFKAAVARADSGAVGVGKLDSLLGYAVTNMTVLAPTNQAFQTLLFGSIYSYLTDSLKVPAEVAQPQAAALSASPAVFENPALFAALPAAKVKGILAYHFLATNAGNGFQPNVRAFSNNFSATPETYTTLVNTSVAVHPGIMAQATFAGPFVTDLTFTGMGTFPTGGAPFSGAPAKAVAKDKLAVNGVYHLIDKVLLPQ